MLTEETAGPEVAKLADENAGRVIAPEDEGFDQARRIHNGMIDKRPGLIVECLGTKDVVNAIQFAREHDAEISVRGGGHNAAGTAVTNGGVMIDLSRMRAIQVDPESRKARVQGGALWSDMNRETQVHGLAVTGGVVSSTGVAGLTLGGGFGWLMGRHGMAVDSLAAAEVVTADGTVVRAAEGENEDLYWGIRGGGGNFGVVPWFEFDVYPVGPMIYGGLVAHPIGAAADVLHFYRDYAWDGPDDRTVFAGLLPAPDGSGLKLAGMIGCHIGAHEEAEEDLAPMRQYGSPLMDAVSPIPYSALNSLLDEGFPRGANYYWKLAFIEELSDEAIEVMISQYETCPSKTSGIVIEHFHGAVTRVPVGATAFPHRTQAFNVLCASVWMNPADTEANVAWTRETFEMISPFLTDRRYGNYVGADDSGESVARAAYGPNFDRLVEVKRVWDPDNVFHLNLNVPPG